ncbi:S-adenosyl-L-methionine-dependent methyltransferase [Neoconidiobolus thromboides FSU 785]|nr:S-adenosyl-L-methionine-dependent methyltransferase [Neoconidiobolus thromboides FSU 785]
MSQKKATKGSDGFKEYYTNIYGSSWKDLLKCLKRPTRHVMIYNFLAKDSEVYKELKSLESKLLESSQSKLETFNKDSELLKFYHKDNWVSNYWDHLLGPQQLKLKGVDVDSEENLAFPPPQVFNDEGLLSHYCLDAASLLPIIALDLKPSDNVLDLCSAPGGKGMLIGQLLFEPQFTEAKEGEYIKRTGRLHCNEMNRSRYDRLRQVMLSYFGKQVIQLPPNNGMEEELKPMLKLTNYDGTLYGLFKEKYDKILIDAPCSSERHLVHLEQLKTFDSKISLNNSHTQLKLLLSAAQMIKLNGRIVYATCSLSDMENDLIIKSFLDRRPGLFKVIEFLPDDKGLEKWGKKTEFGWLCLPHQSFGWGPIYLSVLEKVKEDEFMGTEEFEEVQEQ